MAKSNPGNSITPSGLLLASLDEAFEKRSWHGPNLRGSLRGVTAAKAARRPGKGRHNIWELVLHAAYWKYVVWRRIYGEKRGKFAYPGSNWFPRPDGLVSEKRWQADVALLVEQHQQLRCVVESLAPEELTPRILFMIRGAAAHDLYHAGQIGLLKKLV